MRTYKRSVASKLCPNLSETKEMVSPRPHPNKLCLSPPTLCDAERVQSAKLLCIYLADKLSMTEHTEQTAAFCSQRLYLLCQLNASIEFLMLLSSLNYCMLKARFLLSELTARVNGPS